jgi:hypothetical protein
MYNISTAFDIDAGIVIYIYYWDTQLSARFVAQEIQTQRLVRDCGRRNIDWNIGSQQNWLNKNIA